MSLQHAVADHVLEALRSFAGFNVKVLNSAETPCIGIIAVGSNRLMAMVYFNESGALLIPSPAAAVAARLSACPESGTNGFKYSDPRFPDDLVQRIASCYAGRPVVDTEF